MVQSARRRALPARSAGEAPGREGRQGRTLIATSRPAACRAHDRPRPCRLRRARRLDLVRAESRACLERHLHTPAPRAFASGGPTCELVETSIVGSRTRAVEAAEPRRFASARVVRPAGSTTENSCGAGGPGSGGRSAGDRGGICPQVGHPLVAFLVRSLQPFERLIFFSQPCVNQCRSVGPDDVTFLDRSFSFRRHSRASPTLPARA